MPSTGLTTPNTFASQSGNVAASELDADFAVPVTALNALATMANYFVDTGTAGSLLVSLPSPLTTALVAGLPLQVMVAANNTGSSSVNVSLGSSPLGAKNIVYPGSVAGMLPNQLVAGAIIQLMYDGTNFEYLGPIFGSSAVTMTLTGVSGSAPTGTLNFTVNGHAATVEVPFMTGPSNAVAMTMTGLPTYLQPARQQNVSIPDLVCEDNSVLVGVVNGSGAYAQINPSSSAITFLKNGSSNGWTGSGTKGLTNNFTTTYNLI
jgi:hypothetical protein